EGNRNDLRSLQRSPLRKYTEAIEPNYIYRALEIPNDPDYGKQWNLRSINVETAWDDSKGDGVTVAVIDTGVSAVPDLAETTFVEGYDFVSDRTEASDDKGHGTIAQSTNNNYGVAGVAYKAQIMPLKVLSASGAGEVADIAEAIRFAADHGANVINMSLGGMGDSIVMKSAVDYAHSKGVVIVAAAGNADSNSASFPARYPNVIAVSALDSTGAKAPYSNFGAGVDISAPGGSTAESEAGGILQETIDPQTGAPIFATFQGTSMAAPHVAGVAALIRSAGIENPDEIAAVLKKSARVVKEDPFNYYGAGQLDAGAAVKLALRGQITFKDFFQWLQANGYLNLRFWFDGGVVALLPKIGMVLGSYLLAWFLRNYLPAFLSFSLSSGLIFGSAGLFFLRGLYIYDMPQYPFRFLGSAIPEWGSALQGSSALNPLFASVLIPLGLVALLLGHRSWKWFAVGASLGMASFLAISAVIDPALMGLGSGAIARLFLATNALLCFGLARMAAPAAAKSEGTTV
ncbi:MAG: peptidase S8, partial [Synechococcales cyanobacterium T60_A2020_003]|nr:peptidase S8 [Synechococcales cyanobacterium T60_A2020_003]